MIFILGEGWQGSEINLLPCKAKVDVVMEGGSKVQRVHRPGLELPGYVVKRRNPCSDPLGRRSPPPSFSRYRSGSYHLALGQAGNVCTAIYGMHCTVRLAGGDARWRFLALWLNHTSPGCANTLSQHLVNSSQSSRSQVALFSRLQAIVEQSVSISPLLPSIQRRWAERPALCRY